MTPGELLVSAVAAVGLLAVPQAAFAHRLNVFAFEEAGEVRVEVYSSRGVKAKGATVRVLGADDAELLSVKTDVAGTCRFARPAPGALKIVAQTADGHRAEFLLERAGSGSSAGDAGPDTPRSEIEQLRAEIHELRKERREVSVRDVVAGLGLVFGLTALVAHMLGRRARERNAR